MQGATGGALQPLSQAVLLEAFPPQDRGKAMAFWALGIVVAPILGPVLGGWLTDSYSWRWVFYINLPVGITSLVMTKLFIFDPPYLRKEGSADRLLGHRHARRRDRRAPDRARQGAGRGLVLVARHHGARDHRGRHARRAHLPRAGAPSDPIVDLRVFKERSYAVGVFLMTVVGFVLYGSMVLLPIMLQTLLGYPALQAGIAMAPRGVGSFFMMPVMGILTGRFDARKLLTAGLLIGGVTLHLARRSSTCRPATGTSSGRSSSRASACRSCSSRSRR